MGFRLSPQPAGPDNEAIRELRDSVKDLNNLCFGQQKIRRNLCKVYLNG